MTALGNSTALPKERCLQVRRKAALAIAAGATGRFVRTADLYAKRSEGPVSAILPRHHVVSQRRNSIQGVQLFGRGGAHSSEVAIVAIVAIVAVAGRRISFFELSLPHARVSASSLCDLRVT
jgi:hypothetical protein